MKIYTLLISIVISVAFASCDEPGCTDPDAYNFEDFAEKDDGSCAYEGYLTFVYSEASTETLSSGGSIIVTVGGQIQTVNPFGTSQAELNQCPNRYVHALKEQKNEVIGFSFTSELNGTVGISDGIISIDANTCKVVVI